MLKNKSMKSKGKIKFSQCFQELKDGDKVAIVREHSFNPNFPKRIQGQTGTIVGKRGNAYILEVMDGNEMKTHIMAAIHLKKIKDLKK
jgi:large subunit ribosomal protein L21e